MKYYTVFAQAYGEGNYGNCNYNATNSSTCVAAGTSGSNNNSGGLANTGVGLAVLLTVACLIIFISLVVRLWRRKPLAEVVNVEEVDATEEKRLSDRY